MTDYLLSVDSYADVIALYQSVPFDGSNIDGIGINLWTVGSLEASVAAAITYKMRGMDASVNGLYDTWLAAGAPDTGGTYYSGALALPLRDVTIVDSWTTPPAYITSGNPYIDPPSSPNSFDDEFSSGSADLSVRGWGVKTLAGVTLTRGGDINPWDTTGPVGNTYWSSIVGSWIFIQGPASTQIFLYKAVTLAPGDTYFTRCGTPYRHDSSASGRYQEVAFWANASGTPDPANRVYVSIYETSTAPVNLDMGRNLASAFGGTSRNKWYRTDIKGINYQASTNTYRTFGVDSGSGDAVVNSPTGGPAGSSLVYFGIAHVAGPAGATPSMLAVDFVRKKTANAWIVP